MSTLQGRATAPPGARIWELARQRDMHSFVHAGEGLLGTMRWGAVLPTGARHYLVTDHRVAELHADRLLARLRESGLNVTPRTVEPGESAKTFAVYERLANEILVRGIDRGTSLIGVGGGSVLNLVGFLAATLHRGVGLVQVPTTLLAQIDAAIDFKQAINGSNGKNQIGAYYAASVIVVDPTVLGTLPGRQMRSGVAEAVKHGLTEDPYLLRSLGDPAPTLSDTDFLRAIMERTITLKADGLADASPDGRAEMIGQYGHAVAHALEHVTGHDLLHGEALAIGMCVMARVAQIRGMCDEATVDAHHRIVSRWRLPARVPERVGVDDVLQTMSYDKHASDNVLCAGLVTAPGRLHVADGRCAWDIDFATLRQAIERNRRD
jgi:3-dehydroquinate synthase